MLGIMEKKINYFKTILSGRLHFIKQTQQDVVFHFQQNVYLSLSFFASCVSVDCNSLWIKKKNLRRAVYFF